MFLGLRGLLGKLVALGFFFVWVRCCFPRYRYDLLMYRAWKVILPFSLLFLFFVLAWFYKFSRNCSKQGFQGSL